MVMTTISNDEIRLILCCSSFSLPLGLIIDLQVRIYFTMAAVISLLWDCSTWQKKKRIRHETSAVVNTGSAVLR